MGLQRAKALLKFRHAFLGWAGNPLADNSLIGKHHGLILDLLVQGQDVIIDERALQVEK